MSKYEEYFILEEKCKKLEERVKELLQKIKDLEKEKDETK
jgi:hypothetical protein